MAWFYLLLPEPPPEIRTRTPARTLTNAVPRTADQEWATTVLAYLRDLKTLKDHRAEHTKEKPPFWKKKKGEEGGEGGEGGGGEGAGGRKKK